LVLVLEGQWSLSNLQVGTRRLDQRQGIGVEGPGLAIVQDVRIRTASFDGDGLLARRAGRMHLYGAIEINEDLHDQREGEENWASIRAEDHGTVQFQQREGASLSIGNGSLRAAYYGCVRLGCASAKITSWTTGNNLSIGDSGRIDLHGTEATLRGRHPDNSLIGLEDDGHILAEDAHVILESVEQTAAPLFRSTPGGNSGVPRALHRPCRQRSLGSPSLASYADAISRVTSSSRRVRPFGTLRRRPLTEG